MKFIIDSHLPPLLAERLTAAGYESWHVGEVTDRDAPDGVIWTMAARLGCGVLSSVARAAQSFAASETIVELR